MKVVLLEDPNQHRTEGVSKSRSIWEYVLTWVEIGKGESELVTSLSQADEMLSIGGIDWLVIHHFDNYAVDSLRKKYPRVKYAASGVFILPEEECEPGSIAEEFRNQLKEHYDFLLPDLDNSILKMMGKENLY